VLPCYIIFHNFWQKQLFLVQRLDFVAGWLWRQYKVVQKLLFCTLRLIPISRWLRIYTVSAAETNLSLIYYYLRKLGYGRAVDTPHQG